MTLNAARSNSDGIIDREAWKAHRGECFAHRFWGNDEQRHGLLAHRAGGHGGSAWRFQLGARPVLDEEQ